MSPLVQNIATIGILVFLETALSIDNALVLAIIARGVPEHQQKKVLTYGLVGAIVFRMIAIGFAAALTKYTWVKVLGGVYLLYLAAKYFFTEGKDENAMAKPRTFWMTVLMVELTDIAFAIDSILAAVAMTRVYWIVVTAGLIGTFMMRFAAQAMIGLLKKYPNLETTAYILITIIGVKVLVEAAELPGVDFHDGTSPWAYLPWILMIGALLYGIRKPKKL